MLHLSYDDLNILHLDNSDVLEIIYENWSPKHINHTKLFTGPSIIEMTEAAGIF